MRTTWNKLSRSHWACRSAVFLSAAQKEERCFDRPSTNGKESPSGRLRRAGRLRRRRVGAPFEPAAVIDRDILLAEQMRAKGDDGRGHAAAAGGDERLVKIDPGGGDGGHQIDRKR